ncbi:MAG: tetratricopeptide repeat protein [Alphaproteobacteria bacterium]
MRFITICILFSIIPTLAFSASGNIADELLAKKKSHAQVVGKFLNAEFYEPLSKGDLDQAAKLFFDDIDFGGERRDNNALYLRNHYHVSLGEYFDAAQVLAEAYANKGDFENTPKILNKIDDNEMLNRILRWDIEQEKSEQPIVKKHDRTFEFLSVMIGGAAGQDDRIIWVMALAEYAQKLAEKKQADKAKEILLQAQSIADELLPVSLSASTAFLILTDAQAHFGDYETAKNNLQKVLNACCKAHPSEKRLIQNRQYHDQAYQALISGALTNGNLVEAEQELSNIESLANRYTASMDIAETYIKAGDIGKAQIYLDTVEKSIINTNYWNFFYESKFKFEEEKAHFLNFLSRRYYEIGDQNKAFSLLDKAVEIYFPEHQRIMFGASISHGRKPQFYPFKDILKTYVLQGRISEIEHALRKTGKYNLPSNIRPVLYDLAIWTAENDDLENFHHILENIKQGETNISAMVKTAMEENKDKYGGQEKFEKAIQHSIQYQNKSLHFEHAKYLLKIAMIFAEKGNKELSRNFLNLYKTNIEQHYKIPFSEYQKNWNYGEPTINIAQVHILEAFINDKKELSQDTFNDILLTVRGSRGSTDGYSFQRKSSALLELSHLLYEFGFGAQANEAIKFSELMTYRINSFGTRYRVPANSRGKNQMYAEIAREYISREEFSDAERVLNLMKDSSGIPKFNGTERSVDIIRQRIRANVIMAALNQKKSEIADSLYSKISHPFLIAVIQGQKNQEQASENLLEFSDIVQNLWSAEEIIFFMPDLLKLAASEKDKSKREALINYAEKIGNLIFHSSRDAYDVVKTSIILANFYAENAQKELMNEHIQRARNYLSQIYDKKLKEKYTKMLNEINSIVETVE